MRHNTTLFCMLLSFCFILPFCSGQLPAQTLPPTTADDQLGALPYQSYHGGDIDMVSLTNGTLNLNYPLIAYPQRGKLHLSFNLFYNNDGQHIGQVCPPKLTCQWFWGYMPTASPLPVEKSDAVVAPAQDVAIFGKDAGVVYDQGKSGQFTMWYGNWSVQTADGALHPLGNLGTLTENNQDPNIYMEPSGPWEALDTTGWRATGTFLASYTPANYSTATAIIDPQGVSYSTANAYEEDPNGNMITLSSGVFTDSLGRQIPRPPTGSSSSNTTTSGCPQPPQVLLAVDHAVLWSVPGPGGTTVSYKFCYAKIMVNMPTIYSPLVRGYPEPEAATLLQSIVLPNGQTWNFQYNDPGDGSTFNGSPVNYGTLTQVSLPTGGTISYMYTTMLNVSTTVCQTSGRWVSSRTVNANDGSGAHTWTYSYGSGSTTVTDPLGDYTIHTFGLGSGCSQYETQTQYYQNSGTLLKTTNTAYGYAASRNIGSAGGYINIAPTQITTTWPSGQVASTSKTYDSGFTYTDFLGYTTNTNGAANIGIYGKVISQSDYDYGSGSSGPLLRQTKTTYMALSGPNASSYLANNLLSLPYTVQVLNGSGAQLSFTQYGYDESTLGSSGVGSTEQHDSAPPDGTYRGNQTSASRWLNSGTLTCQNGHTAGTNSNVTSRNTFFDTGTVQTAADACGNTTTYAYSSTYWGALPTAVTNALSQVTNNTYDFNTGLLASTQDPNLLTTGYTYDSMWRLASVTHPDGAVDTVTYQETTFPYSATKKIQINSSAYKIETSVFDGLGRLSQQQLTSDPQGTDYTETAYDALGRVSTVSNPHRTCGTDLTSSCGTTTYGYDGISRKTSVTYPDNSVLTTAYCGPSTLVTDPTKRWRRSRVDGLGRLVEVDEPNAIGASVASTGCPGTGEPIWVTSYTLEALGNLTSVLQNGSHQRTFTYDSLSRLLCSSNPESATAACPAFGATSFPTGTLTYTYNPDGSATEKTDARSLSTNYTYDALHRELTRTYSNGDPTVATAYDQSACLGLTACQNIGHRTSMTDGAGSEAWAYQVDKTNSRSVHADQRTTTSGSNNITKTATYYIDFAGNVFQAVYPTGRTVNYTYDAADRPSTAADASNGITYATDWQTGFPTSCVATAVCYTPQGTAYAVSIGQTSSFTGLNITDSYNSRLQPGEFKASSTGGSAIDITYNYIDPVNSGNAGHVFGITNNLDTTRSQNFAYDQLNRITSAQTSSTYATSSAHCWAETYSLDAWANLNSISQTTNSNYTGCSQESGFSSTANGNNHIPAFAYDASGNATSDGIYAYAWDSESQLKSAANVNYTYDGDGRRVSKVGSRLYWYGAGSEILAETDASGNTLNEYVFFGGKRVALLPAGSTAQYYVEDSLGTSRIVTNNTGVVCYDADFYPYGGERAYTDSCTQNNYKFEGKERDTETGNDDFGARYYSNRFGRWLSADWSNVPVAVPYANLTNPQTLNLYAMVADDPESFADLSGHYLQGPQGQYGGAYSESDPYGGFAPPQSALSGSAGIDSFAGSYYEQEDERKRAQNQNRPNPKPHLVLIFNGVSTQGLFYIASWKLVMVDGDKMSNPSKEDAKLVPQLYEKEKVDQAYWQGGVNKEGGRFEDMIQVKPDRTIYQYFTMGTKDDKPIPLAVGRDKSGHIVETQKVKVTLSPQVSRGIQYDPYSGP